MINIDLGKIFANSLLQLWPLYLFFLFILAVGIGLRYFDNWIDTLFKKNKLKKYQNWGTEQDILIKLKSLHPKEFEEFVAYLFSKLGYNTEVTGGPNDGGVDVIARKDGKISYIQCKKFISSQVSVGNLRDFYGAIASKLANSKAFFVTTNKFTLEAERFAEDKAIELIDGFSLLKYIKIAGILKEDVPSSNNTCPKCGGKLILRTGEYGQFYGCSNYPRCRFIKQIEIVE